jgi:hypothetical protein
MDAKWIFMLITASLLIGLGIAIANLEKTTVMNNWATRRCDLSVMVAAPFFKPDSDTRSTSDFATDNFEFCMKSVVDTFMANFMKPVNKLSSTHVNTVASATQSVNAIRQTTSTMFSVLSSYLDKFYKQFNTSIFEISRIVQYLRMAFGRINSMATSFIYIGITVFRGILNTIQFVIKVILTICGILLAVIIILFFILFPVIPIIIATLTAIVSTVFALTSVMSDSISADANSKKGGFFCFAKSASILLKNGTIVTMDHIKLGDELSHDCGIITSVITMDGTNETLYDLLGIHVSSSHLVKGTDGIWKSVKEDERSTPINLKTDVLYCFNTTTNNIPVVVPNSPDIILFRDWEEISVNDENGQAFWNYMIMKSLNTYTPKSHNNWKYDLLYESSIGLLHPSTLIKTISGYTPLKNIEIGDFILDNNNKPQIVYGKIQSINDTDSKNHDVYEYIGTDGPVGPVGPVGTVGTVGPDGTIGWRKRPSTIDSTVAIGNQLIVSGGIIVLFDDIIKQERIIRDFTEIGIEHISVTYPFVLFRLRIIE